ncbi:MAG: hypothetical protein HZB19_00920 [Chloroflexi bacterium]|nr:hypothetical protein [Chloroflexota bacterium]
MFQTLKVLFVVLMVIVIGASAYAFAAANTIPDSNAGYAATVVSGYTVSNIAYNLNTDPTKIDTITFDIAPSGANTAAAVTVKIKTGAAVAWKDCTVAAGAVTCTYATPINVVDVTALDIVATSN